MSSLEGNRCEEGHMSSSASPGSVFAVRTHNVALHAPALSVGNRTRTLEELEASSLMLPVSTERVLQGLGTALAQAAEAVASACKRQDLVSTGLPDDLVELAQRLDAARMQGECVSALLQVSLRAGRAARACVLVSSHDGPHRGSA